MTVAAAAPDKSCGDYGLRCKVMQIAALGKTAGARCGYCRIGAGCAIHAGKPGVNPILTRSPSSGWARG